MNFMAQLLHEPTTAAAPKPFLRAIVNVLLGRPKGFDDRDEGRERRIDWNARLAASLKPDPRHLERRRAGKRGWVTRKQREAA